MFGFLGNKKNTFVGVDFGTSSVKVVELYYKNSQTYLSDYGIVDYSQLDKSSKLDYAGQKDEIAKYIKELVDKMDVKTTSVNVAIPGQSGLSVIVEFEEMDEDEIAEAVKIEAGKYIPSSLDDVFLSWDVVAREEKNGIVPVGEEKEESIKKMEVLLVAALKDEVMKYEEVTEKSGLEVKSMELDIFSIARAIVGNTPGAYLIIDIGFGGSNLILVDNGTVRISRSLSIGGNEITKEIISSRNLDWDRAEELKKRGGNDLSISGGESSMTVLDSISLEAKRIINEHLKKSGNLSNNINNVIISGGTSKLKGIDAYFTKKLGIQAVIGNPWKRVAHEDSRLDGKMFELGASFSVAIGLALKSVDEYVRK